MCVHVQLKAAGFLCEQKFYVAEDNGSYTCCKRVSSLKFWSFQNRKPGWLI